MTRGASWLKQVNFARLGMVVLVVAGLALLWKVTPLSEYATPDYIVPKLEAVRSTPWAVPTAMLVYTIGTLAFFPHMAMTATIVLVFSPLQAFSICMTGSLVSGAIGYGVGRLMGIGMLERLLGDTAEKISVYARKGGVVGITLLRFLPIAPYTAVNIALAMLQVPFWTFVIATFLGTLPGTTIASLLGFSALELWQDPDPKNIAMVAGGLLAWTLVIAAAHFGNRYWRTRRQAPA